jgi:peptidoglycan hydrolase CwlO-like protein
MNGHWKLTVILICFLLVVSVFAVMTQVKNNDLQKQIQDQERLELQLKSKDVKIQELEKSIETVKNEGQDQEEVIDQQELLEFLSSYVSAQKTYIKTLQEICRNNGVSYPMFIYAELEE